MNNPAQQPCPVFYISSMIYRMSVHPTPGNHGAPFSKPMVEPRHITAEELRLFRDPENLHGKRFILSTNTNNDSGMYEVIGYSRKRDRTVEYDVLFDDCGDPIMMNAKEMMALLEDSHLMTRTYHL